MHFTLFQILDLLGTFAFAISGASLAIKKEFDVFGIFVLAFVTAIGGGTVRDVLIGEQPVSWMHSSELIICIVFGAFSAIIFNRWMNKLNYFVFLFDAIGLGFFTIAGIEKGLNFELNIFICISLGTISATFGGLIRDIISGEKPMLLMRKEIYAIASASGGCLFFILQFLEVNQSVNVISCISFVFLVRIITSKYGIKLPIIKEK